MNEIMKIVQAFEDSNILLKGDTKTIKKETKEQKGGFVSMLVGTLGTSLLESLLTGKGIVRAGSRIKKRKWIVRCGYGNEMDFLMPPHPLANLEIQKHYLNKPRFNGAYSRNNFPQKINDRAYVINLDEYEDVGTHWIAIFCRKNEIVYFNSFGVEHVPEEIKEFIGNKNIKTNIFRLQANNSRMCGYFCIGFIDYILVGKKLTDFTSMFFPYDFEKNVGIILS